MAKSYWLMKSEPHVFSIEDLKKEGSTLWEGVRNYQARNFMTSGMKLNDEILFYHSSCATPAIVGRAKVCKEAIPDPTQFIKKSPHFDPKATSKKPRWHCVKIAYLEKFPRPLSLIEAKAQASLSQMILLHNSRLSVQPVTSKEFHHILKYCQEA
jgi:predicted RNA-binding protein with PUA-like domain